MFITNYPDQYRLDEPNLLSVVVFLGYKIPDYGEGAKFASIRAALRAREKHIEMFDLKKSMAEHYSIPCTFDGELPSTLFGDDKTPPLRIGQLYLVPDSSGKEVEAALMDAVVIAAEKKVYGVYRTAVGANIIATSPITTAELQDYQRHPDTFFGVYREKGRKVDNAIDIFDFFYATYKHTPRERLLEFIKDAPELDHFKKLPDNELAEAVCERWTYNAMKDHVSQTKEVQS